MRKPQDFLGFFTSACFKSPLLYRLSYASDAASRFVTIACVRELPILLSGFLANFVSVIIAGGDDVAHCPEAVAEDVGFPVQSDEAPIARHRHFPTGSIPNYEASQGI